MPSLEGATLTPGSLNHDSEFYEICVQHCSQILWQISGENPIAARLRSRLLRCRGGEPELAEAAKLPGIGARTLRRRAGR